MLAVFYNQKLLDNTLIVVINNEEVINQDKGKNFVVGYSKDNNVSFINIFNFNTYMKLNDGYLKFDKKLCETINKITKIDLSNFIDENDFVVGQIDVCEEIKGTHLHRCMVNVSNETLQIVCGAKNVRKGIKVVVALDGAIMPYGKIIKPSQLLQTKSNGMICSKKELNLHSTKFNDEGIIELPSEYNLGDKFNEIFNS